jgi:hypothetical protein
MLKGPQPPHVALPLSGAILVATTSIVGSGFSPLALPFLLWSLVPYVALWFLGRVVRDPWPIMGAGAAAIAAELGVRLSVFIWPRGSTAAVMLVFSPLYILVLIMPAGAAIGWVFDKLWRWHAAGRALVAIASPALLALLTLGLARPELFPTTVAKRRALLERIGPPRVVVGADVFESVPISSTSAWHAAAELDGRPGEEIVVIDHAGADLFDATSLDALARIDFPAPHGRLWGSFSALVRLPSSRIAVVQTGGGYSRTRVQDLSGATLWEHAPHPTLPPDALRPADLDGDGTVEFYASSADFTARLDAEGREVWRRDTKMAALTALLPREGEIPAWLLGLEFGRRAIVWDEDGRVLGERAVTAEDSPLTLVDSAGGRAVVHGGGSARGYDLWGSLLFDVELGAFTLSQAVGARLARDRAPYLVLVGRTDTDTKRWRLMIVNPDRETVYDEVLDTFPRPFTARRADGSDALVISSQGALRVLRPQVNGLPREAPRGFNGDSPTGFGSLHGS